MKPLPAPKKPEGVDNKSAYIVGSGLAALTAACYLVRDGQMKGEHVHILEKGAHPPAAPATAGSLRTSAMSCAAAARWTTISRCMWDLFRSIPSIETEGVSVLDEYYWLNKHDPNYSLMPRHRVNRGQDAHTDGKFDISDKGAMEIMKLFFTPNEDLQDKTHHRLSSTTRCSTPTSGSTGARCSPLRTGTARWR